jgi:mRNA interferase MazF
MAVVKARHPKRGDVHLMGLDPTRGREIKKTRPCVVVSPDDLNSHLQTVIVAPLTSSGKAHPFRVPRVFDEKQGLIVLDRIRTVDRERPVAIDVATPFESELLSAVESKLSIQLRAD